MLQKLKNIVSRDYSATGCTFVGNAQSLLRFTIDGRNYLAEYNRDIDPFFFRVMLPIVEIIEDVSKNKIQERMVKVSSKYKIGKAILVGNNVWLATDVFIFDEKDLAILFARMVSILNDIFIDYKDLENE